MVTIFQFFKEPSCCFPQKMHQFTFPLTVQENFLFSTSSPAFTICSLLNDGHSDWHELISHYSLDFYFSNSWQCLVSLLVPTDDLYVFFREMPTSVQFSWSVVSDSLQPMNHSTPGLPIHHQLLESTQTYVHCVSDAIQPSHPLWSPSPPALNLSQHQGLFN